MAVASRGGGRTTTAELQIPMKWKEREISPERTKVWTESSSHKTERKVCVIYYLSRNGQLEHPHFIEVSLSSSEGLYLRDVINRLNILRGKGMANMYSWSSKRSYKNGFVWNDLTENDFIYPSHGQEYVLKGSELLNLNPSVNSTPQETTSSSSAESQKPAEIRKSGEICSNFPVVTRRRNQSWSAIDLHEYKVYKAESTGDSSRKSAADAATQTDDKRRRRRTTVKEEEKEEEEERPEPPFQNQTTELSRDEISPPPSDSSPETLESLMKADGRLMLCSGGSTIETVNPTADIHLTGRMKASSVLMQLLSCGSISFRDCGPSSGKESGLSLISHYKPRLLRGTGNQTARNVGTPEEIPNFTRMKLEDKEYFSGSLIETKKEEIPALKRSSSYNADRSSNLQLVEKEENRERTKCIPRKTKLPAPARKECHNEISSSNGRNCEKR